jgi:predicted O-methyltransferase YrrM
MGGSDSDQTSSSNSTGVLSGPVFAAAVERLRVPGMGTEVVAPLLASLVQMHRPQRVLEVGMGYTTPFLVAAVADVERQVRAEQQGLAEKSRRRLDAGERLDDDWLYTEPALLAPSWYREPYRPRVVAVDNLSIPGSSAPLVLDVLRELEVDDHVEVVNADLRECADRLPAELFPIDFAWVDAWDCLWFFRNFWERINPDGGILAMHYLMTYPEGEAILDYLASVQRARPGELEMINLLEGHKLGQNSVTLLRRTGGARPRPYGTTGSAVRYDDALHTAAEAQVEAALAGRPRFT